MHKGRAAEEAMDSRLLKPPIWAVEERRYQAAKRAAAAGNGGKQPLDLDAPLLSGRRNRDLAGGSAANAFATRINRNSSSFRKPLVPFFTWEQPPPAPLAIPAPPPRISLPGDGDGDGALVLAPPPETRAAAARKKMNREVDGFLEFADARSEFANTETRSIAPTYQVSNLVEDDEEDDGDDRAMVEYNSCDREMILQRFLPAAKAVAREMAWQQQGGGGEVRAIAHPSPQGHQYRIKAPAIAARQERAPDPAKKKSFAELLRMGDEEATRDRDRDRDRSSKNRRHDHSDDAPPRREVDEGCCPSQRYAAAVGNSACGFFPLLRMIHASKARRNLSTRKVADKFAGERDGGDSGGSSSSSTEWYSDDEEGGDGGGADECDEGDADAEDEKFWKNGGYLACRYTPLRGGLKSPAVANCKGFLGMPRDRRVGATFVKRMYPVTAGRNGENVTPSRNGNDGSIMPWTNGNESDSSESLTSIRLDRLSRATSRQNSDVAAAVMEKVFCLDTLNQSRQCADSSSSSTPLRKSIKKKVESGGVDASFVLGYEKPTAEEVKVVYVPSKAKIVTAKKSPQMPQHGFEEEEELAKVRLCWRGGDGDDVKLSTSSSIVLPTLRGPSGSWLREKLLKTPGKPPRHKSLWRKRTSSEDS